MKIPDPSHRIAGTTFPAGLGPGDGERLGERAPRLRDRILGALLGLAVDRVRLVPGDVLVVRGDVPAEVRVAIVRALHRGQPGDPVAVFLPRHCAVHVEGRKLDVEDRGYRETKTMEVDKRAIPPRGVFTGVQDGRDMEEDREAE